MLQYKGTITWKPTQDVPRTLWRRQSYDSVAPDDVYPDSQINFQQSLVRGCGSISGTISVRLKWTGTNDPSYYPNYVVHPYASAWTPSNRFSGTASNGVLSVTARIAEADSLRLVQPGKTRESETTGSLSASVPDDVHGTIGCAFDAHLDDRYARIALVGAGDSKKVRLTGSQVRPFPIPDADEPKSVQWAEAVPESVAETLVGANWSKTIDVGLSQGKSTITSQFGGYRVEEVNPFTDLSYSAVVAQSRIPNEWYDFTCDYTSASETLPSLTWTGYDGWNILGVSDVRANPKVIVRDGDFDTEQVGDIGQTAKANLKYKWADGLEAEAKLNVKLRRAAEQVADLAIVRCTSWSAAPEAVPLKGGVASPNASSWLYTEVPTPEVYKWVSNTLSVGGKLIPFKPAAIACTIYNLFLPYVTPPAIEVLFERRGSIDKSVDTIGWGGITPGLTYDPTQFAWQASTIPQRDDRWIVVDRYGLGGFIERAPMLAGSKKRTPAQSTLDARRYH